MGRGWRSLEVHAGKILEQNVDVNTILKAFPEGSQIETRGSLLKTGEKRRKTRQYCDGIITVALNPTPS